MRFLENRFSWISIHRAYTNYFVDIISILLSSGALKGDKDPMGTNIINTSKAPRPVGPYSQAVKANGWLYISGQIPIDSETGESVDGPFELQARVVLNNLKEILEAGGSGLDRVVKVMIFLTDMKCFAQLNDIYAEYFGESCPARACVEVNCLPKDAPLEIEAVAICD